VTPHGHKHVVQLDGDGAEGQEPSHCHLEHQHVVPRKGRDLTRDVARAARRLEFRRPVLASDSTQHHKRETNCWDESKKEMKE